MKKMMALVAALTMAATLMAAPAQFPYQAVLKDSSGRALTGTKQVRLRLYNAATGGTLLWGRTYSVLLDANGLFNIEVSDSKGTAISGLTKTLDTVLAENFGTEKSIYISLEVVGTSGEILPRQLLQSVPYAAVASNVSRATADFTVSKNLQANTVRVTQGLTANSVSVTGAASAGSINTSGNATISGNLTVSGTISGFGIAPVGTIIMWSSSTIPNGWSICNGQTVNGIKTPDLSGRFIVGVGSGYSVGNTGGEATHVLTEAEMPRHRHQYKFTGADISAAYKRSNFFYNQAAQYSDLSNSAYTEYTGSSAAHENRPPYYALYFIMRTN